MVPGGWRAAMMSTTSRAAVGALLLVLSVIIGLASGAGVLPGGPLVQVCRPSPMCFISPCSLRRCICVLAGTVHIVYRF